MRKPGPMKLASQRLEEDSQHGNKSLASCVTLGKNLTSRVAWVCECVYDGVCASVHVSENVGDCTAARVSSRGCECARVRTHVNMCECVCLPDHGPMCVKVCLCVHGPWEFELMRM